MSKPSDSKSSKSGNQLVQDESVEGFESFKKRIKELEEAKPSVGIILFFTGSDDPKTKACWCPNCRHVESLLPELKKKFRPDTVLLRVKVGQLADLMKPESENPFYMDQRLKVLGIPVIMVWNTKKRLGPGHQVKDLALLSLLLEEE